MRIVAPAFTLLAFVAACGETGVGDLTVEVPPVPPGAIEYRLSAQTVPSGKDAIFCYYLDPLEEEMYVRGLAEYQTKFGHHIALFKTIVPQAPGTIELCESGEDMAKLIPIMASEQFGLSEFPDGMGIRVGRGTQMVIQQHIINTSIEDIVVEDTAHLLTAPAAEIETTAGFIGLSDITFKIEPGDREGIVDFECEVPFDMNVLVFGPHMHESGVRITTDVETQAGMQGIYDISPWEASYRDDPPVTEYTQDAPLALQQGDRLHTTCLFDNKGPRTLEFPVEMCATFGYYFPAPEGSEQWVCSGL